MKQRQRRQEIARKRIIQKNLRKDRNRIIRMQNAPASKEQLELKISYLTKWVQNDCKHIKKEESLIRILKGYATTTFIMAILLTIGIVIKIYTLVIFIALGIDSTAFLVIIFMIFARKDTLGPTMEQNIRDIEKLRRLECQYNEMYHK